MRFPSAPPPYPGSCLCARVQYELTHWPLTYYACHCTDCQRRTGSAMRLAMWVRRDALVVREGDAKLYTFEFGGRERHYRGCAVCCSRLWAEPEHRPKLAVLLAGTLRQQREFEPVAHIWTRSSLPWVEIPPGVAAYETQPDDPMELVRLWKQATGGRYGST